MTGQLMVGCRERLKNGRGRNKGGGGGCPKISQECGVWVGGAGLSVAERQSNWVQVGCQWFSAQVSII